ncbi:MAG: hypothetical protein J5J06_07810 [Phycisphaerae bacterium]|nr:hypothetical protein [Phycisphaerae bacterium]
MLDDWLSGPLCPNLEIGPWGLRLFWWSRIGNCLTLMGPVTIVIELLGADRLRDLSESARARCRYKWEGVVDNFAEGARLGLLLVLASAAIVAILAVLGSVLGRGNTLTLVAVCATMLVILGVGFGIPFAAALITSVPSFGFFLFFGFASFALGRPMLAIAAKVFTFCTILMGFCIDMLAS